MGGFDFQGRTVLVVGGSSGIGNGIAQQFRAHGAEVHVWGTRVSADAYRAEDGSDLDGLRYQQVDVGDREAIVACQPPFQRLDVLVLSQGTVVYRRGEFEQPGWDRVIGVNLDSVMACAVKFKPLLSEARGSLIVISSISGSRANLGNPAYAASKAGAISLTKSLAAAWAGDQIRVNGIAPGLVDTKLTKVTTENPKRRDAALATIPMARMGTPEDMAGAALFLASPYAAYVCGQTLTVDGGLTLS
ncbi:SDR family NAD(P)-dependent oxidoreductase [Chelatococcus reniformis]|uniref:3-oxoacyl-ACP reductase n=1 Tax=Chelatococcus reniformis TaxID=1494448 RepID=A0A916U7C5_9HYPH|nr:SDR family oxidoreductase [Chelatococcus reniformis]GGC62471.1 3-oxoacyl-ACP reductase [Chelatococcus reniformis]